MEKSKVNVNDTEELLKYLAINILKSKPNDPVGYLSLIHLLI